MRIRERSCNESVWINFDHKKGKTVGKCISRQKFQEIPQITEISGTECCSHIRTGSCDKPKCIDESSI